MHGFVLQPWVTLKGTSTATSITQSEVDYLDLAPFADFAAWVEVSELTTGGSLSPTIWLETAPLKDESLFNPTGGAQTSTPLVVGLSTPKNILNAPLVSQIPLSRWLRWRISMTGAGSIWSVTFQVHVAAHSMCLPATA